MYFSEKEVKFLMEGHRDPDMRSMARVDAQTGQVRYPILESGCPEEIILKILEDRARRLGSKFNEFRRRTLWEQDDAIRRVFDRRPTEKATEVAIDHLI